MENYIKYRGKGEHTLLTLEKIIEQREEELHLIKSTHAQLASEDKKELLEALIDLVWLFEKGALPDEIQESISFKASKLIKKHETI